MRLIRTAMIGKGKVLPKSVSEARDLVIRFGQGILGMRKHFRCKNAGLISAWQTAFTLFEILGTFWRLSCSFDGWVRNFGTGMRKKIASNHRVLELGSLNKFQNFKFSRASRHS